MLAHHRIKEGPKSRCKRARAWDAGKKLLSELLKDAPRPLTKRQVRHLFCKARQIARARGA